VSEKFVFNAFINLALVQRSKDRFTWYEKI